MADRKADRHAPGRQVGVSLRLDKPDFDALETRRKALKLTRRAAIIAAIRRWTRETTETPKEAQK